MPARNGLSWFALAIYLVLLVQYFSQIRFNSPLVPVVLVGSVVAALVGLGKLLRGTPAN